MVDDDKGSNTYGFRVNVLSIGREVTTDFQAPIMGTFKFGVQNKKGEAVSDSQEGRNEGKNKVNMETKGDKDQRRDSSNTSTKGKEIKVSNKSRKQKQISSGLMGINLGSRADGLGGGAESRNNVGFGVQARKIGEVGMGFYSLILPIIR